MIKFGGLYLEANYIENFFMKYNLSDLLLSIYSIEWIKEFDKYLSK